MAQTKPLTRSQCQHALILLDDRTGMSKDIYRFTIDKWFWDKTRKFTSARFIDLLERLHKAGRWQDANEKAILDKYIDILENFNLPK